MKSPDNKRKSEISPMKQAIEEMLKSYKIDRKFNQTSLVKSWGAIMGAPIANRTTELFIKDKTLFVTLNSAPLKQELTIGKKKVLELFRKEFGEDVIDEIIFR